MVSRPNAKVAILRGILATISCGSASAAELGSTDSQPPLNYGATSETAEFCVTGPRAPPKDREKPTGKKVPECAKQEPIDWSGPYIEGMFGYNWDQPSYGGVISAQVGDNIQVGRLVPGFSGGVETAGGAHQVWTAFAIGRLGYDLGRFLPYVGVGPAVTNFDHAGTGVSSAIGWTAVSGVSYRLDRNWSLTAEFSHDDFSPQAQSLAGSHRKSSDNGVRLGITFAFPSDR